MSIHSKDKHLQPRVLVGSKMGTSETGLEVTPLCLGYEREEGEEGKGGVMKYIPAVHASSYQEV